MSRVVLMLPNSNSAIGSRGRNSPARWRLRNSNRARSRTGTAVAIRRARVAATLIAAAAKVPGIRAKKNELRRPTVATRIEASSGPTTAPRLSPARSTPKARP
jgi:hypothetical protein